MCATCRWKVQRLDGSWSKTQRAMYLRTNARVLGLRYSPPPCESLGNVSDEMNLHIPQGPLARVEIEQLLMVPRQIISPKGSTPVIGIVQDALLGASMITHKSTFMERSFVLQVCMYIKEFNGILPEPAILKPKRLWTGKQIVSLLIPDTLYMHGRGNGFSSKKGESPWVQIQQDNLVVIERGTLLAGTFDKKTLGISGGSIIHLIFKDYGPQRSKLFLNEIQYITNYFLLHHGFSVGISDCILEQKDREIIFEMINKAMLGVEEIQATEEYTIKTEEKINRILNGVHADVATYVKDNCPLENSLARMVRCGSKGNPLNLAQMMGVLGQQNVCGKRVPPGYGGRSCPHVEFHDNSPAAGGFVANPYYDGLTPLEVLFHTMGGREGLVDTAIKVIDYMCNCDFLLLTFF